MAWSQGWRVLFYEAAALLMSALSASLFAGASLAGLFLLTQAAALGGIAEASVALFGSFFSLSAPPAPLDELPLQIGVWIGASVLILTLWASVSYFFSGVSVGNAIIYIDLRQRIWGDNVLMKDGRNGEAKGGGRAMLSYVLEKIVGSKNDRDLKKLRHVVERVNALEPSVKNLTDEQLSAKTAEFRERLSNGETTDDLLPEAFAVVRETAWRQIGERPYDVQILGAVVLHQGRIAEMRTGEGKTLTSTMPVYLNALTGRGVHVVTVNEFLAQRDADWMGQIYKALGMTVGITLEGRPRSVKKAAYECDITYGTNSEFGFDYLRDHSSARSIEEKTQRELHYSIVDEVDSILIDEARTPHIISERRKEKSGISAHRARRLPFEKREAF